MTFPQISKITQTLFSLAILAHQRNFSLYHYSLSPFAPSREHRKGIVPKSSLIKRNKMMIPAKVYSYALHILGQSCKDGYLHH